MKIERLKSEGRGIGRAPSRGCPEVLNITLRYLRRLREEVDEQLPKIGMPTQRESSLH